ncbi:hypothetical protein F2P79_025516 [Pimephales promelas]|nr:hypothetical protein F2P79_025516 [Pimephales promelas]
MSTHTHTHTQAVEDLRGSILQEWLERCLSGSGLDGSGPAVVLVPVEDLPGRVLLLVSCWLSV